MYLKVKVCKGLQNHGQRFFYPINFLIWGTKNAVIIDNMVKITQLQYTRLDFN